MKRFWLALGSAALIASAPAFAQTASSAAHPQVLLKTSEGDLVKLVTPTGAHEIEILSVSYPATGSAGTA